MGFGEGWPAPRGHTLMAVHWAALLTAAVLALMPDTAWAARRIFAGDTVSKTGEAKSNSRHQRFHDSSYEEEEVDLLDLIHRAYNPPLGSYGYGGYGHYCYGGYYGYGGGYGEPLDDSDAAFEDLLSRGADLEAWQRGNDRIHDRRGYDVYGMPYRPAEEDEQRMTRRAEAAHHRLYLDLGPDLIFGEADPYIENDNGGDDGDDSSWDDGLDLLHFPWLEPSPGPHGCYYGGQYPGGCYGGYYGCGCYGGYGGYGYGGDIEELYDNPHNLELQEALLEVRQHLRRGGAARRDLGREAAELLE